MKKSIELLKQGFESSSYKTPEFINFANTFKRELTKELKNADCTLVKYNVGHFYVYGFFKTPSGELYYFSLGDLRGSEILMRESSGMKMLYRTAITTDDYTGGRNQWVDIEPDMIVNLNLI